MCSRPHILSTTFVHGGIKNVLSQAERETHPENSRGSARLSLMFDNSGQDHGSHTLFENVQATRVLLMLRMLKTALWPEVYKCLQADTHTHTHARAASSFAPLLRAVASCARASAAGVCVSKMRVPKANSFCDGSLSLLEGYVVRLLVTDTRCWLWTPTKHGPCTLFRRSLFSTCNRRTQSIEPTWEMGHEIGEGGERKHGDGLRIRQRHAQHWHHSCTLKPWHKNIT